MNRSRWFAVLALWVVPLAAPAVAQPYPQPYPAEPYYGVISPRDVMRTVAGMGLQPVSEPRLRGNVWIVRGAGREGTIVRVVVDAHTGRVVDMGAVREPGRYMGPGEPGPYQPDPRYVTRDPRYPPEARAYPAPRPGEVYQAEPAYPGPGGAAVSDDDDDDNYGQPVPQPRGYEPRSSYPTNDMPRVSAKPEVKRLAAKSPAVPLPKARPDNIQGDIKTGAASKDDGKNDEAKKAEAKQEEPKHEQASAPLTSPKSPETTGSISAENKNQPPVAQPKKQELPPVQPLE